MFEDIARSVRYKVMAIVLASTLVALLVATAALLVYEVRSARNAWISDLVTQAEILAISNAPALAFQDQKAASANLALLRGRQNIRAAALYTAENELFATYSEYPDRETFPAGPGTLRHLIQGDNLYVFLPVIEDQQMLGTVYLRGQYNLLARVRDYLLILGGIMLTSLLVALLLSSRLQASVTRPIRGLTDAAYRVIGSRDFTQRVRKTTEDEIGVLVDAFNSMLAEVGHRSQALERADRHKDEFLATLSHELRNPLAPMVNALAILEKPGVDERLAQRARDMLGRQLAQMVRLVNDLLDVSRISTGKLTVQKKPEELGAILRGAIDTARPLLSGRRQELSVDLPEPVEVLGDATRLSQVFANLLNNAAKYTAPGGRISLATSVDAEEVHVQIADDGIGIDPGKLTMIFEMFNQIDNSIERAQAGLGVGLTLARRLVELHGGRIEAASPGLGQGSTFTVHLPRLRAGAPSAAEGESAPTTTAGRRILLVDDNVDYATSLCVLLQGLGHEVRLAHDAPGALVEAGSFSPEFAFLDIGLPGMSGYDLARCLRAAPETAAITLVAVTGWGQEKDRQMAKDAGFDQHLTKPVLPATIQKVLGSTAKNRSAECAST